MHAHSPYEDLEKFLMYTWHASNYACVEKTCCTVSPYKTDRKVNLELHATLKQVTIMFKLPETNLLSLSSLG